MSGWTITGNNTSLANGALTTTNVVFGHSSGYPSIQGFDPYSWNHTVDMRDMLIRLQLQSVIKDELKSVSLDLGSINKLLSGSSEDKAVAIELLKAETKYTWKIIQSDMGYSSIGNLDSILYEINMNNGFRQLNKEWL